MFKQTSLITWRKDTNEQTRTALLEQATSMVTADFSHLAPVLEPPSFCGGNLIWHLHFADRAAWASSRANQALDMIAASPDVEDLDSAAYSATRGLTRDPLLRNGIYRTLFIGVSERATPAQWRELAEDLAAMPEHIPEIVNWALNGTVASRGAIRWTHVWEQEFVDLEGLVVAYLNNPYHIYHVDRWFDGESPCCVIGPTSIRHSASRVEESIMRKY